MTPTGTVIRHGQVSVVGAARRRNRSPGNARGLRGVVRISRHGI
jgi:hypothetical protein